MYELQSYRDNPEVVDLLLRLLIGIEWQKDFSYVDVACFDPLGD